MYVISGLITWNRITNQEVSPGGKIICLLCFFELIKFVRVEYRAEFIHTCAQRSEVSIKRSLLSLFALFPEPWSSWPPAKPRDPLDTAFRTASFKGRWESTLGWLRGP